MEIAELKKYSRPRRYLRQGQLAVKKVQPITRGKDIVWTDKRRYKITARSRQNPLTHWILTPLSNRDRNGETCSPIEISEQEIVEALAEQTADRTYMKGLVSPKSLGTGRCVCHNGSPVI